MKRICVFCGSSPGRRPEYARAAEELGAELVRRKIGLVYGGGNVGLMGVLADAVLKAGGEAVTWTQLGLHAKPCGVLNVLVYYTPFVACTGAVASGAGREMAGSGDDIATAWKYTHENKRT